jgi:hypothetical protein
VVVEYTRRVAVDPRDGGPLVLPAGWRERYGHQAVGHETEVSEGREIARLRAGRGRDADVIRTAQLVRFDDSRLEVDDPEVRHAVPRVEVSLRAAVDDGGARREDLDGEA